MIQPKTEFLDSITRPTFSLLCLRNVTYPVACFMWIIEGKLFKFLQKFLRVATVRKQERACVSENISTSGACLIFALVLGKDWNFYTMPKVKRSKKPPPDGWELIEPTIDELDQKMKECKIIFNTVLFNEWAIKSELAISEYMWCLYHCT